MQGNNFSLVKGSSTTGMHCHRLFIGGFHACIFVLCVFQFVLSGLVEISSL